MVDNLASTLDARQSARFQAAFAAAERDGVRLLVNARTVALLAIAAWIALSFPPWSAGYYASLSLGFVAPGLLLGRMSRSNLYRPWFKYLMAGADSVLLTAVLLLPNPFEPEPMPLQMTLRLGNFPYFFIFLAGAALTTSPRFVLWTGMANAVAWGIGGLAVATSAGAAPRPPMDELHSMTVAERMTLYLQPGYVDVHAFQRDVIVMLVVAAVLSASVHRARGLVARRAQTERERAKLARYFSPAMVDQLSEAEGPLREIRRQPAAVLFADIAGFTSMVEERSPEEAIELLRAFHARMEECVFRHGGTLDKYIGDAAMALFGAPIADPLAASNAVGCARAMVESVAEWNQRRVAHGLPTVLIGVGAHYGALVLGDIGGERRLELTVIGDTVNVASRLEKLTRELKADIVVSEVLAQQALAESGSRVLDGFHQAPEQQLRGREAPLGVRIWRRNEVSGDTLANVAARDPAEPKPSMISTTQAAG